MYDGKSSTLHFECPGDILGQNLFIISRFKQMPREKFTQLRKLFFNSQLIGNDYDKMPRFYDEIVSLFGLKEYEHIAFIIIPHMVQDLAYLVECLGSIGQIAAIIPKGSQYVIDIQKRLRRIYREYIYSETRKSLEKPENIRAFFQSLFDKYPNYRFIIVDHGGYFATEMVMSQFKTHIAGIVEHTLNGHLRYEEMIKKTALPFPVFSIAKSHLKSHEDHYVADSIITSMKGTIFAGVGMIKQDFSSLNFGIIGFGHMGSAIAHILRKEIALKNIYICDTSANECQLAKKIFLHVSNKKTELLQYADVIITAASARVLGQDDFNSMRAKTCVVCVTSSDDQFEPNALIGLFQKKVSHNITTYVRKDGTEIYLAYNGKSINFAIGSTSHPIFHAILASVGVSASACLQSPANIDLSTIHQLSKQRFDQIRSVYEKFFGKIERKTESFGLPFSSVYFVGRKKEKEALANILKSRSIGVITQQIDGLGGIGKSSLANNYANEALRDNEYDFVFQADASSTKILYEEFLQLAEIKLNIPKPRQYKPKELVAMVHEYLGRFERLLIIFDNSDEYRILNWSHIQGDIVNFLPPPRTNQIAHCIVTTRNPKFQCEHSITLAPLLPEEACEYINYYLDLEINICEQLAHELSYFPLALSQMVAYLKETSNTTPEEYLERYRNELKVKEELLKHSSLPETLYKATVYTTWNISIEELGREEPFSIFLLYILSFFHSSSIPIDCLQNMSEWPQVINVALSLLQSYSLININDKTGTIKIHPLVQIVSRLKQLEQDPTNMPALIRAFDIAYEYMSDRDDISFIFHALEIIKYHDQHLPHSTPDRKIDLLYKIGSIQLYQMIAREDAKDTFLIHRSICEREKIIGLHALDISIRLGVINPLEFRKIFYDTLNSDQLTFDHFLPLLKAYGIHDQTLVDIKQEILKEPLFQTLFTEEFIRRASPLEPHDFFNLLLTEEIKSKWLCMVQFAPLLIYKFSPEIALASLIFDKQFESATLMAENFLRSTAEKPNTNERVQALTIFVAIALFKGELDTPGKPSIKDLINLLKEAKQILQNDHIEQFYYDMAHFMLAILYALNKDYLHSNQTIFALLEVMLERHGEIGIKNQLNISIQISSLLIDNLENMDKEKLANAKEILTHVHRIHAKILFVLGTATDHPKIEQLFETALSFSPECTMTQFEFALFLARHRQTRQRGFSFFQQISEKVDTRPYPLYAYEANFELPKFMSHLALQSNQIRLHFLVCALMAWISHDEQNIEAFEDRLEALIVMQEEEAPNARSEVLLSCLREFSTQTTIESKMRI